MTQPKPAIASGIGEMMIMICNLADTPVEDMPDLDASFASFAAALEADLAESLDFDLAPVGAPPRPIRKPLTLAASRSTDARTKPVTIRIPGPVLAAIRLQAKAKCVPY